MKNEMLGAYSSYFILINFLSSVRTDGNCGRLPVFFTKTQACFYRSSLHYSISGGVPNFCKLTPH